MFNLQTNNLNINKLILNYIDSSDVNIELNKNINPGNTDINFGNILIIIIYL